MQGPQIQYSTGSPQAAPECKHDIRDEVSDMDLDLPLGETVEEAAKGAPAEDLAPDPLSTFASAILDSMKEVEMPKSPKPSRPGKAPKSYRRREANRRPSPIAKPQKVSKPSSDSNDNRKFIFKLGKSINGRRSLSAEIRYQPAQVATGPEHVTPAPASAPAPTVTSK